VLKVGNEFESPSLYITSEGEKGQWASLSYCWGGNSSFVLTKYTFHDMVRGQRLEAFPKTIHDAILITRALGIAFLWVDALCIFQGSIEDWENEAPKMEEVYSCAVLTIIAANAPAVWGGIFQRRERLTCELPWLSSPSDFNDHSNDQSRNNTAKPSYQRNICVTFAESINSDVLPFPFNSPWASRGWTLQEDLLSWRTLIYAENQMLWRCSCRHVWENGQCEDEDAASGNGSHGLNYYRNPACETPQSDARDTTKCLDKIFRDWYGLVGTYSKRQLTRNSDKLPAISGIARRMQPWIGDSYCAGMWRSDFVFGLIWAWNGAKAHTLNEQILSFNFPSWNWISLNDSVCWPLLRDRGRGGTNYKEIAQFKSISLGYSSKSVYGAIEKGAVVISAPCYFYNLTRSNTMDQEDSLPKFRAFLDEELRENREFQMRHRDGPQESCVLLQLAWFYRTRYPDFGRLPECEIALLVLEPFPKDKLQISTSTDVLYRRVTLILLKKYPKVTWEDGVVYEVREGRSDADAEALEELERQRPWPVKSFEIL
jgi:hypothetical protein